MTRSSHAARSVTRQMVSQGSRAMAGRKLEDAQDDILLNPIPREPLVSAFIETLTKPKTATRAVEKERVVRPEPLGPKQERWLTKVEAAAILEISPNSIMEIASRKKWSKKIGPQVTNARNKPLRLYLESDVEKYLYERSPSQHLAGKKRPKRTKTRLTITQAVEKLEQYQFPEKIEEPKMGKWSDAAEKVQAAPDRLEVVLTRLEAMVKNAEVETIRAYFQNLHDAASQVFDNSKEVHGVVVVDYGTMQSLRQYLDSTHHLMGK